MRTITWLVVLLFGTSPLVAGEARIWKAATGPFQVEAEFVRQTDTHVILKKSDGTELDVVKEKLSAGDLTFLAELAKPATAQPIAEAVEAKATVAKTTEAVAAPAIDYAAITKELTATPPLPKFTLLHQYKIDLPNPKSAILAEGGKFLCTYQEAEHKLDVWDLTTGKLLHTWKCGQLANPYCFAISPTGKYLAAGRADQIVVTYEIANSKELFQHEASKNDNQPLFRVAFNWQEEYVYFVNVASDFYYFPISGGMGKKSALHVVTKQKPEWDPNDRRFQLVISPTGRMGINLTPTYYQTENTNRDRLGQNYGPIPGQIADAWTVAHPIPNSLLSWNSKNAIRLAQLSDQSGKHQRNIFARTGLTRTVPLKLALDQKEQYIWAFGYAFGSAAVEIHSLDYFENPLTLPLPWKKAKKIDPKDNHWISPAAGWVVRWNDAENTIEIYALGELNPPAFWKVHHAFHKALLEETYEWIDGVARELFKVKTGFPGGTGKPMMHEVMMGFHMPLFYEHPVDWEKRLEKWVKDRPKSQFARIAYANYKICEGWAARGSGRANSVTEEGWATFHEMGQLANELLKPVLDQPEPPGAAFFLQLRVAKMLSWDLDQQLDLVTRMLRVSPDYAPFHEEMVVNLLPRWFGEQGSSVKYAEKVAERLGAGRGEYMYAAMALELSKFHSPRTFQAETQFDLLRVMRALLLEYSQKPEEAYLVQKVGRWVLYTSQGQHALLDDNDVRRDFEQAETARVKNFERLSWNLYADQVDQVSRELMQEVKNEIYAEIEQLR
jgi:hypothetical protein